MWLSNTEGKEIPKTLIRKKKSMLLSNREGKEIQNLLSNKEKSPVKMYCTGKGNSQESTNDYKNSFSLVVNFSRLCSRKNDVITCAHNCPVSWGYRIHWLHLCRGVRPLSINLPVGHEWQPVILQNEIGGWSVCDLATEVVI